MQDNRLHAQLSSAMPTSRFEQLEIVDPAGHIQFVDLDPAVGLLNIGAHTANDVTIDGPGVRPFHALLDFRQQPYQVLFLDESGVGESATPLDQWQSVRVGNYELLLAREAAAGPAPAMPAAQTSMPVSRPSAPPVPAPRPQESTAVSADGSRYALNINNSGNVPATFHIAVLDVAPEWVLVEPPQCVLQPAQQTQVTLSLHPELPPGSYTLTWQITSPDYGQWQQTGQLTLLATAPYQSIDWGELEPRTVRSQLLRRSGRAILPLTNLAEKPAHYFLWAKDLRGDCRIRFALPATAQAITTFSAPQSDRCEVILPPGVTVPLAVSIAPAEGRVIALRTLRYRFVIQGGFNAKGPVDRAITGTFESRPVIHGGWLVFLLMLLLLAAIVTFRGQIGAWIDTWRFGEAAAPTPLVLPTPSLIHGFSAEELARYRQVGGTGGQDGAAPQAAPDSLEAIFKEVGRQYNVDWRLLAALAYRESRLDPRAVGRSGEYGLMQIMPNTWNEWAPLLQVNDPWDAYSNVSVGAAYYSYIHGYFSDIGFGDERWAIAAYNFGPERVLQILDHGARWGDIPLPQRQYTADILIGLDDVPAQVARVDAGQ
ncbi:MAG: transglycosylase SLT domain-containing protein [Caldilineaceae bacterium]|nr:transglycosylase SLT domain-containing protein [Caldilineaceae bacterium]